MLPSTLSRLFCHLKVGLRSSAFPNFKGIVWVLRRARLAQKYTEFNNHCITHHQHDSAFLHLISKMSGLKT